MSIAVALERLRRETERFANTPYLLTVSGDGRPHAVAISAAWEGSRLVASVGRRSAENAGARPRVSVLWPPFEAGGYSLIVDGDAALLGAGEEGARVAITPTRGVLHRPAKGSAGLAEGCSADCVPLLR
jgi:hypothetical protein